MDKRNILKVAVLFVFSIVMFNLEQVTPETVQAASTYTTVINGVEWSYSFTSNMGVVVGLREPRDCEQDLVIPDFIGDHPVTGIASGAFYGAERLSRVYIPETVETINVNAFGRCAKLTYVYFGGSADEWGNLLRNMASGNSDLQNAWQFYYMDMGVPETSIVKDGEVTKVRIEYSEPMYFDRYNKDFNEFGDFTYQWYYSPNGEIADGTLIEGATEYCYTVTELGLNYYYFCKLTNTYDIATKVTYSNPVQVITQSELGGWIASGTMIDKYGNTGTQENPYIIRNNNDFDQFMYEIYYATNGSPLSFEGRYIKVELSDKNNVLYAGIYAKELMNFKGTLDANHCVIKDLVIGGWGDTFLEEDMAGLEAALGRIRNVVYKDTTIYIKDYNCMMQWYQWYYGTATKDLTDKNIRFENLEVCLEK